MVFRFDRFELDADDRLLRRDGAPVDLSPRYLDALILLVAAEGRLVPKARFLDEAWRGVPVTDEALTQAIRTLRRALGDDAARPRFIETVPKHGYRFVAPVEVGQAGAMRPAAASVGGQPPVPTPHARRDVILRLGRDGMLGAGAAGVIGGLFYGSMVVSDGGTGGISTLLVITCLTVLVALAGGAGVGFGIAAGTLARSRHEAWGVLGGAAGGALVGALAKLIGLDAFNLLFGEAPTAMTGAAEGLALGGAVGLGAWAAVRMPGLRAGRRGVIAAGLIAAAAGVLVSLAGGRTMGGSLALLADFPRSNLSLDAIGRLFGETGFGPISRAVTAALEGLLFGGGVVAGLTVARRKSADEA